MPQSHLASSVARPATRMPAPLAVEPFRAQSFEPPNHYYPRVLNAQLHPLVHAFLRLGNERIVARYLHLHPEVEPASARQLFGDRPRHFRWGGADLLHVTTSTGVRRVALIETNSCPSGQKSMPRVDDEDTGYRRLLERAFLPILRRRGLPAGGLAVLYDKNRMEASGYASMLAELTGEIVYLVPCFDEDVDRPCRFDDGVLFILVDGSWRPIRAAFRYVTQRPWNRIPAVSRTAIFNPVVVCLAGGRNKLLAAKAYDLFNGEVASSGLRIRTPETFWDVSKAEVPMWVERLGGCAVVKVPYGNAGQGVYTITHSDELRAFMDIEHRYDRFIVQALVGNSTWSSNTAEGRFYHVGTIPNRRGHIHVADLRFMVGADSSGFFPVAMYARRARKPLSSQLAPNTDSWSMLGTNLSVRTPDGAWSSETDRLLLMDQRDFSHLGLGIDDFVEAYVQTVLAIKAIDTMAQRLVTLKGRFRRRFFGRMNPDEMLLREIDAQ